MSSGPIEKNTIRKRGAREPSRETALRESNRASCPFSFIRRRCTKVAVAAALTEAGARQSRSKAALITRKARASRRNY